MTSEYKEKVLDVKVENLPFTNFLTSRYSMTVRIPAQQTYDFAKSEGMSFFNLTTACLLKAINEIPEFKYRIKDGHVVEYEKINAISPIMQPDHSICEIEIKPISEFNSIKEWNSYIENKKKNIEDNQFIVEPSLRDVLPIANFSCIPWINFDSMTNIIAEPNQIMPVVSWGKFVDGKIPISLTASHIFVFGWQFKLFYEKAEDYLTHPEKLIN
ncbi:chloramphenicol O-acetyltransferase [Piromyces finnis]|uniref:Chloramphenicol O-acetyltransferase n=1 Tax=Piromyces finnis TaxID=1754191 RepID=A0A1Y1VD69_9FUNG|nr:chloramphenicol O-acetyltransferase [Piromyces finnis]|eukprot:ORX52254.1 chloramphenicol O-acetyltransferase [Piromyces finnis]